MAVLEKHLHFLSFDPFLKAKLAGNVFREHFPHFASSIYFPFCRSSSLFWHAKLDNLNNIFQSIFECVWFFFRLWQLFFVLDAKLKAIALLLLHIVCGIASSSALNFNRNHNNYKCMDSFNKERDELSQLIWGPIRFQKQHHFLE